MTATIRPLRQPATTSSRSPERTALAAAIERHSTAEQRFAAVNQALEGSASAISVANRGVRDAEAAIEQAKADAADHLAATMMGTAGAAPVSVKQARANLLDAEDKRDAAQAARGALEQEHKAAKQSLTIARMNLTDAVHAVVHADSATQALINAFNAAQRRYVDLRRAMESLDGHGLPFRFFGTEESWPDLPGGTPWKQALIALETNADAPLPTSASS